jgi:hypothetical protein
MTNQFNNISRKLILIVAEATLDPRINEGYFGDFSIDYNLKGDKSDFETLEITFNLAYSFVPGRISISPNGNEVELSPSYESWKKNIAEEKRNSFTEHIYKSIDQLLLEEGFSFDGKKSYQK